MAQKAEYDKQGKYFWHLARTAGWTEERVNALILKRWKATHWNALSADEKRAAINMMRGYVIKADKSRAKALRQTIMAIVKTNAQTIDWLHEQMTAWGYGDSLRALSFADTVRVYELVKGCFPPQRVRAAK